MSLLSELKDSPPVLATSSKFTSLNGLIYIAAGVLLMVWPGALQTLFFETDFVGREAELTRVLGMAVAIIGWLYFFGGRSGGRQVVAASVVDRLTLVPFFLVAIALAGVFPRFLLLFAILDPLLGLVAWYLLARERR